LENKRDRDIERAREREGERERSVCAGVRESKREGLSAIIKKKYSQLTCENRNAHITFVGGIVIDVIVEQSFAGETLRGVCRVLADTAKDCTEV
jgi:hypothetical protein